MRLSHLAPFLSLCASFVAAQTGPEPARVLVFSKTNGYRHASIPDAAKALEKWGAKSNLDFDRTEDSSKFTDENLANYDIVLFLMTTDETTNPVLNTAQAKAFHDYINKGGNFAGFHAASVCLFNEAWYVRLLGSSFAGHPRLQPQTFVPLTDHPITRGVPKRWTFPEELYRFSSDPRDVGAKVLLTAVEGHDPLAGSHGTPHPIAWYQEHNAGAAKNATLKGRSFYSSLGHTSELWKDETYMEYVMAGIEWTLGGRTTRALNQDALVGNAHAFPYQGEYASVDPANLPIGGLKEPVNNAVKDPKTAVNNAVKNPADTITTTSTGEPLPDAESGATALFTGQAFVTAVVASLFALAF